MSQNDLVLSHSAASSRPTLPTKEAASSSSDAATGADNAEKALIVLDADSTPEVDLLGAMALLGIQHLVLEGLMKDVKETSATGSAGSAASNTSSTTTTTDADAVDDQLEELRDGWSLFHRLFYVQTSRGWKDRICTLFHGDRIVKY